MRTSEVFENFNWHSEEGICKNIKKVKSEFVQYRVISPIKILLMGAPYTKKT